MGKKTYDLIRWILGVVFIYSGITKLMDMSAFSVIIDAYGFLPEFMTFPAAVGLSLLEVVAGAGLLLDIRGALSSITAMLVLFIGVLGYGIMMGLDIDCGCFGPEDPEARAYAGLRPAFYRDLVMMAGIVYLYLFRFTKKHYPISAASMLQGSR